ncbi:MAG: hypothetical protein HY658_14110 [Actinobacteria bacterium]|nr:hypothetical protein [Actinomycetota bacterium]
MAQVAVAQQRGWLGRFVEDLNGRYHRAALWTFMVVVIAHWAEHLVQAFQIWALGMERPESRGVLGLVFPWLVSSEALHYGYAIVMLAGLLLLRPGFTGRARTWWDIALVIQFWHHLEHALLLGQAVVGANLFGQPVPTSIAQVVIPRVELHLLYNALVFIPMVIAMIHHVHPSPEERHSVSCTCASATRRELAPAGAGH